MLCHLLRVVVDRIGYVVQFIHGQGQKIIQPRPQIDGQANTGLFNNGGC
ncbi:hypothetical protein SDC9_139607 [bioreactor metagenome]|uniref:Uncharacterized protein n=1 Tax=bioreactor metagenome TaxID=1076179 RepID=A0A645DVU9_9ZZZZ